MSYSNSFPTQRPTLNLDFANSGKLDSRISYSRSSTGTALSSERHLSSENLLLQSQDFDTSWTTDGIAAPTGSQTAPDGTSTAWLLTCNSGTAIGPRILQSYSVAANTEYTMVAHLKAGTASHGYAVFRSDSTYQYAAAMLDFAAGTISVTSAGMTSASGTVTALGSNWFRVTVTATTSTSVSSPFAQIGISDGTAIGQYGRPSWNPVGTETMYAWGAQLSTTNSKVYDSPTTTQIHREYAPTLKTFAADEPRFEYTTDGESEGLLIEASATNLQRYGSGFGSWSSLYNVVVTSNAGVGPNGSLDADLVVADSTLADHYVYDNGPTLASGNDYTASVYVKDAGQRYVQMIGSVANFGGSKWATFDLVAGTIDANNVTASMVSVGNGWWRIQATMSATGSTTGNIFIALTNNATAPRSSSWTGDNYSGVLLFGYQLETGSSASSLVDTGTGSSQLTRSADSCSVATADFGYTGGPVSIVIETPAGAGAGYIPYLFSLTGGDQNFYAFKNTTTASASDDWRYQVGGTGTTVSGSAGSDTVAIRWDTGDVKAQFSAGVSSTNSGAVETAFTGLKIGQSPANLNQLNGNLKRLSLYSVALSDTELAALVD